MPSGSGIIVRADEKRYKILQNWPLCATMAFARPEMVDPKRRGNLQLGCAYFGVWNEAGENL